MKKIHLAVSLSFFAILLLSPRVFAQTPALSTPTPTITETPMVTATVTPTPTPTAEPETTINIVTKVGTQYPWNRRIPVKLKITPKVSGQRLEVRWQSQASIIGLPASAVITNPQAGRTYTFSFELTPRASSYQRAVADVILTTVTTNYVSSTNIPLQLDQNRVIVPMTAGYIFYTISMYTVLILVFLVIIPFAAYKFYTYFSKTLLPKWLESKFSKPI